MATRTSSATWEGNLKEGKGTMKVGRGAYEGPFSFASRFENGAGTNPEELIGAAEAECACIKDDGCRHVRNGEHGHEVEDGHA